MADQYHRKISYMRISVTDLCNMRCCYCMPEKGILKRKHSEQLSFEEIEKVVRASVPLGIRKIRLTGGEPLVRKDIVSLVDQLNQIPGIEEVTMTTNGTFLKNMARPLKEAGLTRFNISIDSLDPRRYRKITRGGNLEDVMEGIRTVLALDMKPLKLNTVIIGGLNEDEIHDFADLTRRDSIDVRFIELMPVGEAAQWAHQRFISNEWIRQQLSLDQPGFREKGSPAQYYQYQGAPGKVGLINPISQHFCEECNRIRLTSDGKLKPCLHSDEEFDVLTALSGSLQEVTDRVDEAIRHKPEKHALSSEILCTQRNMCQIGG